MATVGQNMKWTIQRGDREKMKAFFEQGLSAKRVKELPDTDLYALEGGGMIGCALVDASGALTEQQAFLAPWVEFEVADPKATIQAFEKLGLKRVDYFDKEHAYFRAPGGVVFRLAARQK